MNQFVMEKIIDTLRERQRRETSDSSSIDSAKFYSISTLPSENISTKIASVDGGQSELFATPTSAVYILRVAHVVYQQNRCLQRSSRTWLALFALSDSVLVVDLFDEQGMQCTKEFLLSSLVPVPQRNDFLSFSPYTGFVREYLELEECQRVARDLKQGDILLRDGLLSNLSLHPPLSQLTTFCQQRGIALLGFAKTTTMKTAQGESFPGALARVAQQGSWYYKSSASAFSVFFVKLHRRAQYIFHVETLSGADAPSIFSHLAHHACDPIFLGYPYGLIAVDQVARVSNQEQSYFKMLFESRSGSFWKELQPLRNAVHAHAILDTIH